MFWDGGWGELRKYELYEAATKNDLQRLNELITTRGVDVTFVNHNDNGKTVLHKAAELGHVESVCYILGLKKRDFLLAHKDNSNLLAIDYATQNNHKQIVELLQNPDDATMLLMDKLKF